MLQSLTTIHPLFQPGPWYFFLFCFVRCCYCQGSSFHHMEPRMSLLQSQRMSDNGRMSRGCTGCLKKEIRWVHRMWNSGGLGVGRQPYDRDLSVERLLQTATIVCISTTTITSRTTLSLKNLNLCLNLIRL
ncbi:hypothetical protein EJ05DRAFT_358907 [Pseudovirgaria hyperparasitica]|uniref:Uncharacterized protein n=1 Tax=Pseudovirgaria hyperparasitica TaxID=470096 RepID=A0A6A6W6X5_9PEZI|nr:uncharacterized protein EJ05DRAFT_358907 [Pseudovirgaria hyperparasitica]KAF2758612.1 hypothetical protein EJ05DRAFT_358907 [Pseudovirgaria hyperparasitica]